MDSGAQEEDTAARAAPLALGLAIAACGLLLLALLYLVGRPLHTADLWWQLALGESFLSDGLWIDADPLVHTAVERAPSPHEWLFCVAVRVVDRATGLTGLRVLHAAAVAAIALQVFFVGRRAGRSALAGCVVLCIFVALSWYRLFQLRPDLVSIPATLAIHQLLLADGEPPSWRRVMAALVIGVVWVNCHPLFAIGPALVLAAWLGLALQGLLAHWKPFVDAESGVARARTRRLGLSGLLLLAVGLLNPRGVAQLTTFVVSAQQTNLWVIADEWTPFNPLAWRHYIGGSVTGVGWAATDLILLLFAAGSIWGFARFFAEPGRARLRDLDPVRFGIGLAGCVALLVSIRFLWMAIFPVLYLVHVGRVVARERPAFRRSRSWVAAASCLVLTIGTSSSSAFLHWLPSADDYLSSAYARYEYPEAAVHFLRETEVEGRLFNTYGDGGFLGYWLAPRLRVFLDGRGESPAEILREYAKINAQLGDGGARSFLQLIESRDVNFFLGVGVPTAPDRANKARYTTSHLAGAPGWVLVFRSFDSAVYARLNRPNIENLVRIQRWYARRGVAFDPTRGLDPEQLVREQPRFAIARGLLPTDYVLRRSRREDPVPETRARHLEYLGLALALAGAYESGLAVEEEALLLDPQRASALQRTVYAGLRLRRPRVVEAAVQQLAVADPEGARSEAFLRVAALYLARHTAATGYDPSLERAINSLALLNEGPDRRVLERRYLLPPPLERHD